jgi:Ca2+/H+ antiporter
MKNSLVSKLSVFGFALLIGAFLAGTAFVYIQKSSFYAIAMGVFFVSALIVYESAIFRVKNEDEDSARFSFISDLTQPKRLAKRLHNR